MKSIAAIFKFFLYSFFLLFLIGLAGAIFLPSVISRSSYASQSVQSAPASNAAVTQGASGSNWSYYQNKDEMRNKTDFYAQTVSKNTVQLEFPYSGGTRLKITLRKSAKFGDDVYLTIDKGQFHCDIFDCKVSAKFDDGAIKTFKALEAEGGDTDVLFISAAKNFANNLKKSKRLILEVGIFNHGMEQFTFDVSGLEWKHFGNAATKRSR